MNDDVERSLVERLEAAGRGVEPAPGAWTRARTRAFAAPSRPTHARWFAFAAAMLALTIVFSAASYASSPGAPLFQLQRGLDGTLLALPLPSEIHAKALVSIGERRIVQAAQVASHASATVVSDLLDEGSAHYENARSTAGTLPVDAGAPIFRDLARSERNAAGALRQSIPTASQENQQLLQRREGQLNDGAHDDERRSENDSQHGNEN